MRLYTKDFPKMTVIEDKDTGWITSKYSVHKIDKSEASNLINELTSNRKDYKHGK